MVGDEHPHASLNARGLQHMSHQRLTAPTSNHIASLLHRNDAIVRSLKYKLRDIRRNISEALFFIRESGIGIVRKESKMQ